MSRRAPVEKHVNLDGVYCVVQKQALGVCQVQTSQCAGFSKESIILAHQFADFAATATKLNLFNVCLPIRACRFVRKFAGMLTVASADVAMWLPWPIPPIGANGWPAGRRMCWAVAAAVETCHTATVPEAMCTETLVSLSSGRALAASNVSHHCLDLACQAQGFDAWDLRL